MTKITITEKTETIMGSFFIAIYDLITTISALEFSCIQYKSSDFIKYNIKDTWDYTKLILVTKLNGIAVTNQLVTRIILLVGTYILCGFMSFTSANVYNFFTSIAVS